VSALGITSSSTALSWPHGTEFADTFLKLAVFSGLSFWLSCDDADFCRFLQELPFALLQRLADVDYCKSLIAERMYRELTDSSNGLVFGIPATAHTLSHTIFECIRTEYVDKLVPVVFILVCLKYDYSK